MNIVTLRPDDRADDGLHRYIASHAGGDRDVPTDVEPGSDADIDRDDEPEGEDQRDVGGEAKEPSPEDDALDDADAGEQMDDNIDDLGRRPDGSRQEQPGLSK